jgi:hypothetical protein
MPVEIRVDRNAIQNALSILNDLAAGRDPAAGGSKRVVLDSIGSMATALNEEYAVLREIENAFRQLCVQTRAALAAGEVKFTGADLQMGQAFDEINGATMGGR